MNAAEIFQRVKTSPCRVFSFSPKDGFDVIRIERENHVLLPENAWELCEITEFLLKHFGKLNYVQLLIFPWKRIVSTVNDSNANDLPPGRNPLISPNADGPGI